LFRFEPKIFFVCFENTLVTNAAVESLVLPESYFPLKI
jgi:hypothetical protein